MIRNHVCDGCGEAKPWSDTWEWFGSYADLDNSKRVLKTCSESCRQAVRAKGGAPKALARIRRAEAA